MLRPAHLSAQSQAAAATAVLLNFCLYLTALADVPAPTQASAPPTGAAANAPTSAITPAPASLAGSPTVSAPDASSAAQISLPAAESSTSSSSAPPASHAATPTNKEAPFPLSSKLSRTVQKVTGINLLTGAVTSEVAKHVLQHKLGGTVKVKVHTYSLTDTLAGKIKSVSVQTDGCKVKDVPLGNVAVKSENPIWYDFKRGKGHKTGLQQPVAMMVKAQVDEEQVARALSTEAISKSLRGLKLDLPGLGETQLQILNPKVQLTGEAVKIDATLVTLGASPDTGVPILISAKPVLQGPQDHAGKYADIVPGD